MSSKNWLNRTYTSAYYSIGEILGFALMFGAVLALIALSVVKLQAMQQEAQQQKDAIAVSAVQQSTKSESTCIDGFKFVDRKQIIDQHGHGVPCQ